MIHHQFGSCNFLMKMMKVNKLTYDMVLIGRLLREKLYLKQVRMSKATASKITIFYGSFQGNIETSCRSF